MDTFFHQKKALATGRTYHFVDQLPAGYNPQRNRTILCIHGFPDCWIGWKHQIWHWVGAGYRVVVPDMLGYGETDKPDDPQEYSLKKISEDLKSILDVIRVDAAYVIGHDWGSHIAGRFALWFPDRVLGVAHISIGYFPPVSSWKSLEETVRGTIYEYQLYFADEKCIEEIENNLRAFFRYAFHTFVFSGPYGIPAKFGKIITGRTQPELGVFLLEGEELEYMVSQNGKMRGPTNYYRTWEIRSKEEKKAALNQTYREGTPVLFLRGDQDGTSTTDAMQTTRELYPRAKIITYKGAGHWLMIEKKDEVAKDVLAWLDPPRTKL